MDEEVIQTYELSLDETSWIKCLRCGLTSYNANDIHHRFCGRCKHFHDDLWPPARKWWLEQGKDKHENRS